MTVPALRYPWHHNAVDLDPSREQRARRRIEANDPVLAGAEYRIVLPPSDRYNCHAYAAGFTDRWLLPPLGTDCAHCWWPPNLPDEHTLANFIRAFQTRGYHLCADDPAPEPGTTKIVIYVKVDKPDYPSHTARQTPTGTWVSKQGRGWGIEHQTPHDIAGPNGQGNPVVCMSRPANHELGLSVVNGFGGGGQFRCVNNFQKDRLRIATADRPGDLIQPSFGQRHG